jgi:hypothetical protein
MHTLSGAKPACASQEYTCFVQASIGCLAKDTHHRNAVANGEERANGNGSLPWCWCRPEKQKQTKLAAMSGCSSLEIVLLLTIYCMARIPKAGTSL